MGVALHVRVNECENRAAKRQVQGERVSEQYHHQKRDKAKAAEQRDGFPGLDATGGQWAVLGTLHVSVPLPIGEIINRTSRCSHHEHTEREYNNVGHGWAAIAGQPKRPVGRP